MADPYASIMKQSDGGFAPSYNLQISTDATAGVIIDIGNRMLRYRQGRRFPGNRHN